MYSHLFQVRKKNNSTKANDATKTVVKQIDRGKQQLESVKETEVTFDKYTWFLINIAEQR